MKCIILFVLIVLYNSLNNVYISKYSDCEKPLKVLRLNLTNNLTRDSKLWTERNFHHLTYHNIELSGIFIHIITIGVIFVILLWKSFLIICADIKYVRFDINLNVYKRKKSLLSNVT